MRKLFALAVTICGLALAGCQTTLPSLNISNAVALNTVYGIENAYGIAVNAILISWIINMQKIQTLYSSTPHWSWWVGHGIFGVTLGLLGSVLLRRNNARQAEVPLAAS